MEDTLNVFKPTATTNQTLLGKFYRFLSAWLLADIVFLSGGIENFISRLNAKGILGMGDGFTPTQLFWGDGIGMNVLRLLITLIVAGVFGFLYGYLSKRVSMSEKIIVNLINTFWGVFGWITVIALIAIVASPSGASDINNAIGVILHTFTASPFYLTFLFLNLVGIFVAGFYFMDFGSKFYNNPYWTIDKTQNGTLFGIKWYHYLWFWVPIELYAQMGFTLIYATGLALITLVRNFNWFDLLGGVTSDGSQNSIDVAWGKLALIWIAAAILYFLFSYLREILAGEKEMKLVWKILASIGIGFVLPFAAFIFLGA